jgi:hypothetical protein
MPFFAIIAAALALLSLGSFFPGFFFVRRLRWTPLEKLCGSVGLSLVLLYLAAWGVYCLGSRDQRPVYWVIAGACAVLALLSARDAARFFRSFRIRQTMAAFGFLLAWTLTMLSMIRVYSGASSASDWAEHFQRSLFFLDRLPAGTQFIELYALPARPPIQNVLAAFFLGLTADRFEVFQVVFGFLNLLMFLPCVLLLPALGFGRRRALIPLVAIFALNPAVMHNVTYTWTKALPAFYVILALSLYLAGWRKNDRARTLAAFLALAAGILAHYSAGPYAVVLGIHYLVRVYRAGGREWRRAPLVVAPAVLLLATWFGWSFRVYGAKTTLASNTSVTSAEMDPFQNAAKIGGNIVDTIIPAWLRGDAPAWPQPNVDGRLRDEAFVFYQLNLIFAMGSLGGPIIAWLVVRRLLGREPSADRLFWRILVPVAIVLGVAVVGERDPLGVSHLTLLALQTIGLAALASAFPRLNRLVGVAIVAGCCVDFGLGIFLHARIQSLENTPRQKAFAEIEYQGGGQFGSSPPTADTLSEGAQRNWTRKHKIEIFEKWLRELPRGHENDPTFAANWPGVAEQLRSGIASDAAWGGWYARHDGRLEYLGDRVAGQSGAGTEIATGVFLLFFAGCVWLFVRQALIATPARIVREKAKPRVAGVRKR